MAGLGLGLPAASFDSVTLLPLEIGLAVRTAVCHRLTLTQHSGDNEHVSSYCSQVD